MGSVRRCQDTVIISDCVGIPGPPGPHGPVGPSGAGALLTFIQSVPASVWMVTHNFGRLCHVTLFIGDEEVFADVVHDPGLNQVTITWPFPITGRAFLS